MANDANLGNNPVAAALVRLNAHVLGGVVALLAGAGLFIATIALLIQGGDNTGQMLVLLAYFFPGYGISFGGAIAGGLWATLVGYVVGFIVGRAYGPWFLRGAARMLARRGADGNDIVGAHTIVGLRPTPFAAVTASLLALSLFFATNWLFFRYDGVASPNLELLANFLPGFESNPVGSLFGAFWIFVYGFSAAFGIAWIYGKVSMARNR
jgi:hypothetical protein